MIAFESAGVWVVILIEAVFYLNQSLIKFNRIFKMVSFPFPTFSFFAPASTKVRLVRELYSYIDTLT